MPRKFGGSKQIKYLSKFGGYSYCFLGVLKRTRDLPNC